MQLLPFFSFFDMLNFTFAPLNLVWFFKRFEVKLQCGLSTRFGCKFGWLSNIIFATVKLVTILVKEKIFKSQFCFVSLCRGRNEFVLLT